VFSTKRGVCVFRIIVLCSTETVYMCFWICFCVVQAGFGTCVSGMLYMRVCRYIHLGMYNMSPHEYICIYIYKCVHIYIHRVAYGHTYICVYVHVYIYTYIWVYICIFVYLYTYVYVHTYTHIYACISCRIPCMYWTKHQSC